MLEGKSGDQYAQSTLYVFMKYQIINTIIFKCKIIIIYYTPLMGPKQLSVSVDFTKWLKSVAF